MLKILTIVFIEFYFWSSKKESIVTVLMNSVLSVEYQISIVESLFAETRTPELKLNHFWVRLSYLNEKKRYCCNQVSMSLSEKSRKRRQLINSIEILPFLLFLKYEPRDHHSFIVMILNA